MYIKQLQLSDEVYKIVYVPLIQKNFGFKFLETMTRCYNQLQFHVIRPLDGSKLYNTYFV